jgi:hypothetical protein
MESCINLRQGAKIRRRVYRGIKMRRQMKRKSKNFQVHTIGTIGTVVQSLVQNSR